MTSHTLVSPTQTLILRTAARRFNHLVLPLPDECRLAGGTRTRVLSILVRLGLVEEIATTRADSAWRENEAGQKLGLRLTKAGLHAAGINEGKLQPTEATTKSRRPRTPAGSKSEATRATDQPNDPDAAREDAMMSPVSDIEVAAESITAPGGGATDRAPASAATASEKRPAKPPGGKLGLLVTALAQDGGATIDALTSLTGWLPHTTRAAMTRLRQRGRSIVLVKQDNRKTYQIAQPTAAAEVAADAQL
jgi:hypothetical protein